MTYWVIKIVKSAIVNIFATTEEAGLFKSGSAKVVRGTTLDFLVLKTPVLPGLLRYTS